ncbi:MAG: type II secretion system F family protein [Alphaproteobacteria bacterium]|nr:type II secretion system F family protein [Alphaproteobacteria bacterium]
MPLFQYRALRASGGEIAGELMAGDEREVAARLQALGSFPIEISLPTAGAPRLRQAAPAGRRLPPRELILFTRQLSALIGSGVVLDRALTLIAGGQGRAGSRALAGNLLAAIMRGESLSEACAAEPRLPRHYAMIIAAGEARGDTGAALDRLGEVLERSRATSRALLDALIYPATVLFAAVVSVAFLLGFVLPRFEILLSSLQREPPLPMRVLLTLSQAFQVAAMPAGLMLAAALLLLLLRYRDPRFRLSTHRVLLRVPAVGSLIGKLEAERVLHLLGQLVASGVELRSAIAVTREAMPSEASRAGLAISERGIERGDGIAAALAASTILPEMALELARIGDETGDVAPMLLKGGELLRREFEAASRELIGIITPLSIVILGLLIGGVAAAILSTIMDVYNFAS